RYSRALDLAEDLRRFRQREPIRARPAGLLERGVKWMHRNPTAAALIAFVYLALGLFALGLFLHNRQVASYNTQLEDANGQLEQRGQELEQENTRAVNAEQEAGKQRAIALDQKQAAQERLMRSLVFTGQN